MATGASAFSGMAIQSPPFLDLPLELMLQIVEMLTVPELRVLGRANHGFHYFITSHLANTCYKSKLFRLPTDVLKKIATHVSSDSCSRASKSTPGSFARTSHRFYPALMEHVVHLAIEGGTNHFLYHAVQRNNLNLARKILCLGADIHGKDSGRSLYGTPLEFAAKHGQEAMVRVFLDARAGEGKGNARRALLKAISHGHERIALLLWTALNLHDPETPFWYGAHHSSHNDSHNDFEKKTLLSLSCKAGFVTLSSSILQRHDLLQWRKRRIEIRTCILLNILHRAAPRDDDFVERPLPNNFHLIAKLLLEYGANPDMAFDTEELYKIDSEDQWTILPGTIRRWASESSDPRVRDLLLVAERTKLEEPDEASILIGGLTRVPWDDDAWDMINAYWEEDVDPDLRMLDINKRRIVKDIRATNKNRQKIKSRRQATRDRPAHHQGQADRWQRKHGREVLYK